VSALCGRFVAADAFDSPSTLEAVWGRLVASYAMDAEAAKDRPGKLFTVKAAKVLLEYVADQQCEAFDAVGLGCDLRLEAEDVLGQALCVDNHLLHASIFTLPPTPENKPHIRRHIAPPSFRRQ